jgi:hypothetical protein
MNPPYLFISLYSLLTNKVTKILGGMLLFNIIASNDALNRAD